MPAADRRPTAARKPGVSNFSSWLKRRPDGGVPLLSVKPAPWSQEQLPGNPLISLSMEIFTKQQISSNSSKTAPRFNSVTNLSMNMKAGGGFETKLQVVIYSAKK
jgi:hypothetical protein